MNARTDHEALALPVRLASPYAQTIEVTAYGVPMTCEYEYDEGEDPIVTGGPDNWQPGTPSSAQLLSCRIGGVEVYDMLKYEQIETIEEAILRVLE